MKRPLAPPLPTRIRRPPASFAWIDHRLRAPGRLDRLEPEDIALYLFLVLAADRHGLSCWRLDRIERAMPCFTRNQLWDARNRLHALQLIHFRPWRVRDPDGVYQLLPLPHT